MDSSIALGGIGASTSRRTHTWERSYARFLWVSDTLVVAWAVFGTQLAWFGGFDATLDFSRDRTIFALPYLVISSSLFLLWIGVLAAFGTRGPRLLGSGSGEFRTVADSTVRLFGIIAIVAFLAKLDLARGYILVALPTGLAALLFSRWIWRHWLRAERASGRFSSRVVLVGSRESVADVAADLRRSPWSGYFVVGACVPGSAPDATIDGVRVLGDLDALLPALELVHADTVVVTSSTELSSERIRRLSWSLEPGRQHLVLAASISDVSGPRIHMRPVAGLPLIHVETPRFEGMKRFSKRAFDIGIAAVLVAVLSPLLLIVAILVRATSPGPALFQQERIGYRGTGFGMLKFRSMSVDAEARLEELRGAAEDGNGVMFKLKNDPRVTRVGRVIRRFSIDELPQLFNVLAGDMSIVGPRPPLRSEVEMYDSHVHRRFLLKPGITGLWQVSGRSDLSWESTVRLDLYYVENWSVMSDVAILLRTARAVLAREGAY